MTGLLVVAGDNPGAAQLWLLNYPEGTARRMTNDLGHISPYRTDTGWTEIHTVQSAGTVNLWIVPDGEYRKRLPVADWQRQFLFIARQQRRVDDWMGRSFLFPSEGGNPNIWITSPEDSGSERKQLTANGAMNFSPVVTPDE